jgi:hypothetical protein
MKNTSTDEGNKPEKVYKYDDWDRFSDSDNSQESSPCPVCITNVTPPPGALHVLYADPHMLYVNKSVS